MIIHCCQLAAQPAIASSAYLIVLLTPGRILTNCGDFINTCVAATASGVQVCGMTVDGSICQGRLEGISHWAVIGAIMIATVSCVLCNQPSWPMQESVFRCRNLHACTRAQTDTSVTFFCVSVTLGVSSTDKGSQLGIWQQRLQHFAAHRGWKPMYALRPQMRHILIATACIPYVRGTPQYGAVQR